MSKIRRREILADLLRQGSLWSQDALVDALAKAGEPVTQATVSRDLAAIGALRAPDGYRLSDSIGDHAKSPDNEAQLARVIHTHVVSIKLAHATVVIKTAPGHAQMVASVFDQFPPTGVVGTVGGDDTIFLALTSPKLGDRVLKLLTQAMQGSKT